MHDFRPSSAPPFVPRMFTSQAQMYQALRSAPFSKLKYLLTKHDRRRKLRSLASHRVLALDFLTSHFSSFVFSLVFFSFFLTSPTLARKLRYAPINPY
ncbi:hypothetical protein K440DRAFT_632779 [Wilcoxina mikolae CBS 423.85]|nr:hypothetical protein K440DRAFT_632779 [Wilcoxina mikolae CBS 423.85]